MSWVVGAWVLCFVCGCCASGVVLRVWVLCFVGGWVGVCSVMWVSLGALTYGEMQAIIIACHPTWISFFFALTLGGHLALHHTDIEVAGHICTIPPGLLSLHPLLVALSGDELVSRDSLAIPMFSQLSPHFCHHMAVTTWLSP